MVENGEREVKAENPDPKRIRAEIDQIMEQCDMMNKKPMQKKMQKNQ